MDGDKGKETKERYLVVRVIDYPQIGAFLLWLVSFRWSELGEVLAKL